MIKLIIINIIFLLLLIRSRGERKKEERNYCDGELIVSPTLRSPNAELPTLFVARQSQRDRVAIETMLH